MKVKIITALVAIAVVITLVGIGNSDVNDIKVQENEFFIKLSENEIEVFEEKLAAIKVGQAWGEIYPTLGSPDYEATYTTKKTSEPKGILRVYYLVKLHSELVNELHDKSIRLYFSTDNILEEIVRQN